MIEASVIERAIKNAIPDAELKLEDLVGDQDHYAIEVSSELFRNKSLIAQHKMINQALEFCLGTTLHALKITTKVK